MKLVFPAVFEVDKEDDKFINVSFPDIFGAVTFGEGMADAKAMAKDLLKTIADYAKKFKPTSLEKTQENFPFKHVELIEVEVEG